MLVCLVNYVENNCAKLDTFLCCASVSEKMIGKKSRAAKEHCRDTQRRNIHGTNNNKNDLFVQLFVEAGKKKEGCIEKSNKKSDPK